MANDCYLIPEMILRGERVSSSDGRPCMHLNNTLARSIMREHHIEALEQVFDFPALPTELQLQIIEMLSYADLKVIQ